MASSSDEENYNQFRSGLRSFINRADRMIMNFVGETSLPSNNPRNVPKTRESIHKYIDDIDNRSIGKELFHFVNESVSTKLRSSIQNEVRSQSGRNPDRIDEDVVNDCVENIMNNADYQGFEKSLCESIDQMSKQIRSECSSVSIELENVSSWTRASSDHVQMLFREEDDQSVSSSCSVDCWEMLNEERLRELSASLDVLSPQHVQRESLKMLMNSPVAELVTFESWPLLKAQLQSLLIGQSSAAVFETCLQLHVKMMLSSSSLCVREGFTNAAESFYFRCQRSLNKSEYFDADENVMLLSLCKLVTVFQKTLPRYWARFPEQHNESMIEVTVKLLEMDNSRRLTPIHVISFIDPSAKWFQSWMTGQHGRKLLMNVFEKRPEIIRHLYRASTRLLGDLKKKSCEPYGGEIIRVPLSYMNYLLVVHVLNILQSLFQSSQGCQLFNEQMKTVTAHGCVCQLVEFGSEFCNNHICNDFCLGFSVVQLLLGFVEQTIGNKGPFLADDMLESIRQWADSCVPDEWSDLTERDVHSLSHLGDCLLALTDQSDVLQVIIGEVEAADGDVTLMDSVMSITEKLVLATNVTDVFVNVAGLDDVKNKFIKTTCRLWSVHGGISRMLLGGLQLLKVIVEEWDVVLRSGEITPVPGDRASIKSRENVHLRLKEFGAVGFTPKGASVLHDVGLLFDVVNAIDISFDVDCADLLTLSQMATVAAASPALHTILDVFANNLWVLISEEIIAENNLDTSINRLFSKLISVIPTSFLIMTNISFSTDPSELLGVNRLLTAAVIGYQACMCSELACETGLQLLVILCSDLDCWLYLQSEHNLKESLVMLQRSMIMNEDADEQLYADQMTLLRNYLLIKTAEIGGEEEKIVPLNNCDYVDQEDKQWVFMCSEDIPNCYIVNQSELKNAPKDIELFLMESCSGQLDSCWLNYCREQFRKCLTDDEESIELRSQWFGDLMYHVMEALEEIGPTIESSKTENVVQTADESETISDFVFNGCQLVKRYGVRLHILEDNEKVIDDLMEVISDLNSNQRINGFDWFTATVFLLMCGNATKTYVFMKHASSLGVDAWLVSCKLKDLTPWISFCQSVEVIMHKELPLVANALKWSGLAVGQICQLWIGQCFLNVLSWEGICQYMGLCLLMGQDFQVYCMVSIFRHLQKEIMEHSQKEDLSIFLKETRLKGFSFKNYLFFMDYLESKYKDLLHTTMDSGNLTSVLKS